jgi:formylglycine-generating enzyme required for sulfatase activity
MPSPSQGDPLRITEQEPTVTRPGPDAPTDPAPSSVVDARTGSYVPGRDTEPAEREPERGGVPVSVPGYEILGVLGRGGMGVVYKARHLTLKRIVALKMVLAGGHASAQDLARFRLEVEAAARLHHPNIVQVHEVGEAGGHPYCALEFVEGGSLAGKLRGKSLPAREAAKLVETLARAVQLAHSRNVVHRDLKPANVLLAADGTPKIADFGLARQLDSDSGQTQAGAVIGTPSYMAPEQASGGSHEAGPAADVYALGVILYECLSGRPPFRGKTVVETLDMVRTHEPMPPSRGQAAVPLDLETICLKCLRKEPETRYASAAELADDLGRYKRGEPIQARPVGRLERARKWVKRNPVVTGAAAAAVLALAVGATVSYLKFLDAEEQRGIAETQRTDAQKQQKEAEKQTGIAQEKEKQARTEAEKAKKARDFLVRIFQLAGRDAKGGNVTVRDLLADAEKRIPVEFADQPELRAELVKAIADVKRGIARMVPLGMILEVRGAVELRSAAGVRKPAVPQALVHLDDRLTLLPDAQVQLVFLSDLHKERLRPGRAVTIDPRGCQPADAVLERDTSVPMTFVRLPKGTFYMGWNGQAGSARRTEIKEDFEIAVHDVTQGQWQAVMGNNPSWFTHQGHGRNAVVDVFDEELKLFPVEQVSWDQAQEFIKKLNEAERGRGYWYRLPTEAEWEYACRGGATSEEECSHHFYFDKPTNNLTSDRANCNGDIPFGNAPKGKYLRRPTRVGAYPPNKLGLCDMHGNMMQWCSDVPQQVPYARVWRGGCFCFGAPNCTASERSWGVPTTAIDTVGFRLARVRGGPPVAPRVPAPQWNPRQLACQADWKAAAALYARVFLVRPLEDGELGFEYAAVMLLSGDQPGYRKICEQMLERSGQHAVRPYHVARACTLAPGSVKDIALPTKKAADELGQNGGEFWSLTEQGALAYRAGRYNEAATLLEQSLRADNKPGRAVLNWLWLSLVEHRRGKPAEARAWHQNATKWLEQYPKGIPLTPDDSTGRHLHNWLEAQILHREAQRQLAPRK